MVRRPQRLREAAATVGTLAALLALVGRLLCGAVVVDAGTLDDLARLQDAAVLCQADADATGPRRDQAPHPPPGPEIALLTALLLDAAPLLPPEPPALVAPRFSPLDPAPAHARHAPPLLASVAPLPRGPPVLT